MSNIASSLPNESSASATHTISIYTAIQKLILGPGRSTVEPVFAISCDLPQSHPDAPSFRKILSKLSTTYQSYEKSPSHQERFRLDHCSLDPAVGNRDEKISEKLFNWFQESLQEEIKSCSLSSAYKFTRVPHRLQMERIFEKARSAGMVRGEADWGRSHMIHFLASCDETSDDQGGKNRRLTWKFVTQYPLEKQYLLAPLAEKMKEELEETKTELQARVEAGDGKALSEWITVVEDKLTQALDEFQKDPSFEKFVEDLTQVPFMFPSECTQEQIRKYSEEKIEGRMRGGKDFPIVWSSEPEDYAELSEAAE